MIVFWKTADGNSGRLLEDGRYHSSSVPVVVHEGRLWRAMEVEDTWPERNARDTPHPYCEFVMSAPLDADLLRAESWTRSNYQKKVHTIVLQHPDRRHHAWQYGPRRKKCPIC